MKIKYNLYLSSVLNHKAEPFFIYYQLNQRNKHHLKNLFIPLLLLLSFKLYEVISFLSFIITHFIYFVKILYINTIISSYNIYN